METKKAKEADLRQYRLQAWLVGLVVALAALFVAMEYTSHDETVADDSLIEDMAQDFEDIPAIDMRDMTPAAAAHTAPAATEKVKVVERKAAVNEPDQTALTNEANISAQAATGNAQTGAMPTTDDQAQPLTPVPPTDPNNPLNFRVVETLPDFPGGMTAFMKWLRNNLRYPSAARRQKIEGSVVVSFIVNKDGTTSELKVVSSDDPLFDAEALRVMKMLPKWKPGTEMGRPARTMMCIPIVFKL